MTYDFLRTLGAITGLMSELFSSFSKQNCRCSHWSDSTLGKTATGFLSQLRLAKAKMEKFLNLWLCIQTVAARLSNWLEFAAEKAVKRSAKEATASCSVQFSVLGEPDVRLGPIRFVAGAG